MTARIDVRFAVSDTRAEVKLRQFHALGFTKVERVDLMDSYIVDARLTNAQLKRAAPLFYNPLVEEILINRPLAPKKFDHAIEIGFLSGVTDNVGATAKEMIEDFLRKTFKGGENVYSSRVFFLSGKLQEKDAKTIAAGLHNPLIERATIKSFEEFRRSRGMGKKPPRVHLRTTPRVTDVNLDVPDGELARIGQEGIKNADGSRRGPLALDFPSMKTIQGHFHALGRRPTDIELESLAQTWSEHCKHTIFANPLHDVSEGLFKRYIKRTTDMIREEKRREGRRDICVSVFKDNSGAIEFDDKYLVTHKVETHNSPSALDPFGGAITGIVGVNRDTIGFGLGAKPIANTYGFCFADPDDMTPLYRGKNKTNPMISPRRIMDGVVAGVNAGGNQSGIPTPQGFVYFDKRYKGKPLVFVGTVGLIPKKIKGKSSHEKRARPDDHIVMVGGRVGLDGIHGATFSSEALDSRSPATAVQIGDPITQKKLSDAIVKEARDLELYHSITDNGAGGLSSSVSEMAKESGGFKVTLDKVPLKYPGLDPWQIWISESQERMTLAVPKSKWKKFQELMARRGVEATIIGEFTNSGKAEILYHGKKILNLDMRFLHEGLPHRYLEPGHSRIIFKDPLIPVYKDLTPSFLKMLERLNFSSFEFISEQFDHEVQATSVIKPLQGRGRVNGEASIIRTILTSNRGIALSQGLYPLYSDINTYDMAAASMDTAIRNLITVGVDLDHLALLDNFCWCSSTESSRLGQLRRAARACHEIALAYGTPFISGKDSMFNDFKGFDHSGKPIKISIPPTLLISSIGILDGVLKVPSIDFKFAGDSIYVLGDTHAELGGSEFYMMHSKSSKKIGHRLPQVNTFKNTRLYNAYLKTLNKGLIRSAISITRGGLGIALAKTAMAGMLGSEISLKHLEGESYRDDFALFSETQGRILVSIDPRKRKEFEAGMAGNSVSRIGKVTADGRFVINGYKKQRVVETTVEALINVYKKRFKDH
ncbi:phosphoribosylformylglycinamidine synthase [Candidatus Wolfebacteria bacterium]|nr:phosphoribosylformylglycinamidine synthase [Candidatus Wolfebacteria bacterium]